jgi:4-aminobutyrate aminotransferase-like enzyme
MTKQEIILANQQHLFPSVFHYYKEPLVVTKAKDQYVWDIDGNQYLDFFGGIVTISVGHCNDTVNRKVHEQMDKLQHVSTVFANEPQAALAKRIAEITPGGKLTKSFFTNSGTEANETAFLTARCFTGNHEIIALRHSYHGRSALAMAATGNAAWRLGGAAPSGFVHGINAYCYRCPFGLEYPSCNVRCARDMEEMIRTSTSGRVAAFIAEPIQGVGGFIVPPKEYFEIVQGIVKKAGGLFISDEVQTGWGRTGGKWFGIEHWGVQPDMMTSAKGLGNGAPVGLTVARPEVADAMKGATISTFGGNPVTATQAKAVIDFIDENKLMINAAETGAYLHAKLEELKGKFPLIGDVRGMGLMQAIELVEDRESKKPAADATNALMEAARENRLMIGKGGTYGNVIRVTPALNISKSDVDDFALRMEASLQKVTRELTTGQMAGAAR